MKTTQKINLDLTKRGINPRIYAVQGDLYTRMVELSLSTDGVPWQIPKDTKILIRYQKPDLTVGLYDTLPNGRCAYSTRGNTITVAIAPDALTLAGDVPLIVSLIQGQKVLSTFEITLTVEPNHGVEPVSTGAGCNILGILAAPESALEGQILAVEKIDSTGTIQKLKAIDLPDSNSIIEITSDDTLADDGILYRITMTDGSVHTFTVKMPKSAYEYACSGGYTGTEEAFSKKLAAELPTKLSEFENDQGYLITAPVTSVNGKTGDITLDIPAVPAALRNPHALTFTGAVSGTYDGSSAQIIDIPVIAGEPGRDGISATHSWNGTTLTITSASGSSSSDLKGEKGDQGIQGEPGTNGAKGDKGDIGPQGPKGDTGPQGPKGDTGPQGAKGDTGATGATGKDGTSVTHSWNGTTLTITSASGSSSTNLKGAKGDQGIQGIQGEPGADGAKGDKGDTGPQGPKGDKGDTGAAGANGADGVGISSVKQTTTSTADDGNNVITVTLTNGTTSTFKVQNGSKGSKGATGAAGYTPVRGTDYWTTADKAEIKAYVDEAILGGAW